MCNLAIPEVIGIRDSGGVLFLSSTAAGILAGGMVVVLSGTGSFPPCRPARSTSLFAPAAYVHLLPSAAAPWLGLRLLPPLVQTNLHGRVAGGTTGTEAMCRVREEGEQDRSRELGGAIRQGRISGWVFSVVGDRRDGDA